MRRSTVLSLPLQLDFPDNSKSYPWSNIKCVRDFVIVDRNGVVIYCDVHIDDGVAAFFQHRRQVVYNDGEVVNEGLKIKL